MTSLPVVPMYTSTAVRRAVSSRRAADGDDDDDEDDGEADDEDEDIGEMKRSVGVRRLLAQGSRSMRLVCACRGAQGEAEESIFRGQAARCAQEAAAVGRGCHSGEREPRALAV